MLEMTGSSSKIEGLIQVITESGYTILEVSRTGRMAMRRGPPHQPRPQGSRQPPTAAPQQAELPKLASAEILPNEFADLHEEEEE